MRRLLRFAARYPYSAALLAVALGLALLGLAATIGDPADSTPTAPRVVALSPGDDNRDGRIDEDESGWDCTAMGNRLCAADAAPGGEGEVIAAPAECDYSDAPMDVYRLCVTVGAQPAYDWTNPDGSKVGIPAGSELIGGLDEEPGTAAWSDALRALHAEYAEHAPRA
ncbi:hypothetical protein LUR56_31075 [Streptomyces sp. MT29]|nr:hypothetical protein [Streptomyces sp. MT29]